MEPEKPAEGRGGKDGGTEAEGCSRGRVGIGKRKKASKGIGLEYKEQVTIDWGNAPPLTFGIFPEAFSLLV